MPPELIDWKPGVEIQGHEYPSDFDAQVVFDLNTIVQRYGSDVIDFITLPGSEHELMLSQQTPVEQTNESDATATFTICTNQRNRHGNRHNLGVNQHGKGMRFDVWAPTAHVLWAHGKDGVRMPLGVAEDRSGKKLIQASAEKVVSTCRFNQHFGFAMDIFRMVNEKFIRMSSVGFDVVKALALKPAQQSMYGVQNQGYEFVETILQEWSILPIGADPGAMRQCFSDGKVGGEKLDALTMRVIQQYAEDKPAIGKGFDAAMFTARLDKIDQALEALVKQSATPAVAAPVEEVPVVAPAAIVEQKIEEPAPVVQAYDIGAAFEAALQKKMAPIRQSVKSAMADLDRRLVGTSGKR